MTVCQLQIEPKNELATVVISKKKFTRVGLIVENECSFTPIKKKRKKKSVKKNNEKKSFFFSLTGRIYSEEPVVSYLLMCEYLVSIFSTSYHLLLHNLLIPIAIWSPSETYVFVDLLWWHLNSTLVTVFIILEKFVHQNHTQKYKHMGKHRQTATRKTQIHRYRHRNKRLTHMRKHAGNWLKKILSWAAALYYLW